MNKLQERELSDLQDEALELFENHKNAEVRAFAFGWIQAINWMIENNLTNQKIRGGETCK